MKAIGVTQLLQKKFGFLDISDDWKGLMGNLPEAFNGVIFGQSGQGKSELCIRLAKHLTQFGKVAWMGYEQGHDADLQMAAERNNLKDVNKLFVPVDPMDRLRSPVGKETMADVLFEDLYNYLEKRGSPKFVFVDSIDYTGFTFEHYKTLKDKFKKRKGIIWISHAKGREPKLQVSKDIVYDGQFGIYVKGYVAYVNKSRLGGKEPYIIYPEEVKRRIDVDPRQYPKDVIEIVEKIQL